MEMNNNNNNNNNNNSIITEPRKRGRPRKNKIMEKPQKIIERRKTIKENENREIILHLPLFSNKNISPDSEKNAFTMGETSVCEIICETSKDMDDAILTISDQESAKSDNGDNFHISELVNEIKKKNKFIKQLKDEVETLKNVVGENAFMGCREIKSIPMDISFVDNKNGKQIICEKTDIACWWCTYNFDTIPCFIPERYYDNKFYVFGCFCCFDCASAYNLSLADYKVMDRHSLIKKLYRQIKGTNEEIPIAPAKEVLAKFGGPLTIQEYRKTSRAINKDFKLVLPPMVNLVACIEEKTKDKNIVKNSIPEIKYTSVGEKNMIPVKKKLLHDMGSVNIFDTIGIKEKRRTSFFE